MFLYKESNDYYYIHFTRNGKRAKKSTKCKRKSDAMQVFNKFNPNLCTKIKDNYTFFGYYAQYITKIKHTHKYKTIKGYKNTFNFVQRYMIDINIEQITKSHIEAYTQKRIDIHSIYQARGDLIILRRIFNSAIEDGLCKSNPCKYVKCKIPQKSPLYFTKDEFNELVGRISNKDFKNLVVFAVNTGLRLNEIRNLRFENIKDNSIILDNHSFLTKTDRVRVVPLNKSALESICVRSGYIFTYNGKQWSEHYPSKLLKRLVRELGLNDKLNFHSLRHTFASWLVQSGVDLYIVKELLGHSSITTTEVYAHLRKDNLKDAVKKINYLQI